LNKQEEEEDFKLVYAPTIRIIIVNKIIDVNVKVQ